MSTPAQPAPAPAAPSEAPQGEMNVSAFSAALAARPGDPAPAAPTSEEQQIEQQIKEQSAPKVEKPAAEEKKPDEPAKEKTPFDDLPSEEVEKPAAEEKKPDEPEVDTANWPKKQREAFAAARVAQKRLTDELSKAQEAIKQRDAAIEEAKKTGKPDEAMVKEYEEMKAEKYARKVESSPEWKEAVADPINAVMASLKGIADSFGLDNETLLKATDEELPYKRNAAIRKVFKALSEASDTPIDQIELDAAMDEAITEANKLPALYGKMDSLRADAAEKWAAIQARDAARGDEQSKASEADFVKAAEHLYPQLKTKWPSFFKDEATAKSVAEARIDATPEGQALQAQKAALFKPALTELMAARAKIAELEKAVAAWRGSRPEIDSKTPASAKPDDGEMDEDGFARALAQK